MRDSLVHYYFMFYSVYNLAAKVILLVELLGSHSITGIEPNYFGSFNNRALSERTQTPLQFIEE